MSKPAKNTVQVFAEDMSDDWVEFGISKAQEAFDLQFTHVKPFAHIAAYINDGFTAQYGKGWNVIVGRSFGAYVTHEIKTYMYYSVVPGVCVLVWKCEGDPTV
ncbi:dynein light chain putative [Pelagophyceae sp. CCMP2097]|nr:dynein light chain putative [Pelagophyceae sp. CCMP2097]